MFWAIFIPSFAMSNCVLIIIFSMLQMWIMTYSLMEQLYFLTELPSFISPSLLYNFHAALYCNGRKLPHYLIKQYSLQSWAIRQFFRIMNKVRGSLVLLFEKFAWEIWCKIYWYMEGSGSDVFWLIDLCSEVCRMRAHGKVAYLCYSRSVFDVVEK